jgi:ABC-type branched-subunit amino acid transport system ATPase component
MSSGGDIGGEELLDVTDLDFSYGKLQVLFGVSIEARRGERVALLGTNGAGKSTLLRAIAGLVQPSAGHVRLAGQDVTTQPADRRVRAGMTLVEGGRATFPTLTVEENLRLGAYPVLDDAALVDRRLADALELFPALQDKRQQQAGTLSGGEQQMMAIGRALLADPQLLIIDELSLGLAPVVMQQIVEAVDELTSRGLTLLLVEQSLNVALALVERAYFMEKGEVRFSGEATELLDRGDLVRSVFFGQEAS